MKKTTKTTPAKADIDISRNSLLVKLSIPTYKGQSNWKEGAEELASAHEADSESVSTTLKALRPETRRKVMGIRARARGIWQEATLPWLDNGARLCPVANYRKLRDDLEKQKAMFEEAVEELANNYAEIRRDAKKRLNGLFSEVGFPSKEAFVGRFSFNVSIGVIATGTDVRVSSLTADQVEEIRKSVDSENRKQIAESQREALVRVAEKIDHLLAKMSEPAPKAKKGEAPKAPHFKNSIVSNVVEIAEAMRKMNVLEDSKFDELLAGIASKAGRLDPELCRESESNRKKAATAAKAMRKEIDDFSF
jgi:hypothetical protein